jgi:hypothetical protein
MGRLGGSPLGLIGVESRPTRDGMSTFNGGKSRNFNINLYNSGKETNADKLAKAKLGKNDGMFSQFTGGTLLKPWGNISKTGTSNDTTGLSNDYKGVSRTALHNNDVYDTSILNIIEKLSGTRGALRPSDFAYCKNLGVYPNNRLIIARRFSGAIDDNILQKGRGPIAVLISWRKTDEDFIEIGFGEDWIDANADFTELLNNMGKDLLGNSKLGDVAGAAMGAIPLPGFSEGLTRKVLEALGIYEEGASNEPLPAGNPNLIKMAKRRKTIDYGQAGSGLKCTFTIKMECEYEQKFISGVDPTITYMDILSNALRFGTSNSYDYGLSGKFAGKLKKWVNDPQSLITDFATSLKNGLNAASSLMRKSIEDAFNSDIIATRKRNNAKDDDKENKNEIEAKREQRESTLAAFDETFNSVLDSIGDSLIKTVQKYKQEIYGISAALSGVASTPWHVTVGNPLRPIFCAGDLYTDNVQVNLGSTLAFNDLPSNIKIDFTLTPARPWGLQEIMAKFNTGNIRTVNTVSDFSSLRDNRVLDPNVYDYGKTASNTQTNTGGAGGGTNTQTNPGDKNSSQTTTKENQKQQSVNSDPNSNEGAVK